MRHQRDRRFVLPRPYQDSPYSDEPAPSAPSRSHAPKPSRKQTPPRGSRPVVPRHQEPEVFDPPSRRRSKRRGRGGRGTGRPAAPQIHLTSHPTGRAAYAETRAWLLAEHGPVCAYCGRRFTAEVMTLDHVAPRKGLTAFDRRDNLVLACPGCNSAKRDMAPLAFLLARRERAVHLARYGKHLSAGLIEMARMLAPDAAVTDAEARVRWADMDDHDDEINPYAD
jgi:5-methylcytosine-specific restriction endonuclease McrA